MSTSVSLSPVEARIRKNLGVPDSAKAVLILSQSSHMDWDWLETHPTLYDDASAPYFNGSSTSKPAKTIFDQATSLMVATQSKPAPNRYYYSVEVIGFLQDYVEKNPDQLKKLLGVGDLLHLVGGGITSPDNLLTHGETFIRNFLVGWNWLRSYFQLPIRNAWIPDDFGQDSQLPVTLEAMGLRGAGFERIPGANNQGPGATPADPKLQSPATQLTADGIDFLWRAADGSVSLGHWLIGGYGQGDSIDQYGSGASETNAQIAGYLQVNQPSSPTPYVFVPVGSDFQPPKQQLLTYIQNWNKAPASSPSNQGYAKTGVWIVSATFDHYVELVDAYAEANASSTPVLKTQNFDPVPYWLGYYGSRQALKILQYRSARTLMAAEVMAAVSSAAVSSAAAGSSSKPRWATAEQQEVLLEAWGLQAASTHHDYITGTAGANFCDVHGQEQLPRLALAQDRAANLLDTLYEDIANRIAPQPSQQPIQLQAPGWQGVRGDYETPVAVFNDLGFVRGGSASDLATGALVTLPGGAAHGAISVRTGLGTEGLVQPTASGDLLFLSQTPSFGYVTDYLYAPGGDARAPSTKPLVSIRPSDGIEGYILENSFVRVEVRAELDWGIRYLYDLESPTPKKTLLHDTGNALVFYKDSGNIYRYGNEDMTSGQTMTKDTSIRFTDQQAWVAEQGPLRVTLLTQMTAQIQGRPYTYVRSYSLTAGEPFVRMSVTGAAPGRYQSGGNSAGGYTVLVRFPLVQQVETLAHGTANHWSQLPLTPYENWTKPTFYCCHDYLLAQAGGKTQAAIYHDAIPAWGTDSSGALVGNVLRNTPGGQNLYGADGPDRGTHTRHYALRVPSGLDTPQSGQPLREARAFQRPLTARFITNLTTGELPATFSLAQLSDPTGPAMLTVAKANWQDPSELVLRVYQGSNNGGPKDAPLPVVVGLGSGPGSVRGLTALEAKLDPAAEGRLQLSPTASGFRFDATRALTTIGVKI